MQELFPPMFGPVMIMQRLLLTYKESNRQSNCELRNTQRTQILLPKTPKPKKDKEDRDFRHLSMNSSCKFFPVPSLVRQVKGKETTDALNDQNCLSIPITTGTLFNLIYSIAARLPLLLRCIRSQVCYFIFCSCSQLLPLLIDLLLIQNSLTSM